MVMKQAALFVAFVVAMSARGSAQPGPAASPVLALDGDAAIVTILVRPARAAEFDRVIARLKAALQRSEVPGRRAQAAGWQVFRAQEQVQGNVSYVMRIDPVVKDQDYDIPRLLAHELPGEAAELARAYQEAQIARSAMTLSRVSVPGLGPPGVTDGPTVAASSSAQVLSFDAIDAAVLTILVRPELSADFEAALGHVGKSLQASRTAGRRRQAAGWTVYKGTQLFSGSLPYVVSLDPVMSRVEYDPMRLIQETFPADVDAVYAKYRAAYTGQAIARLTNRVVMGTGEQEKK
jgi:hypothetical protein